MRASWVQRAPVSTLPTVTPSPSKPTSCARSASVSTMPYSAIWVRRRWVSLSTTWNFSSWVAPSTFSMTEYSLLPLTLRTSMRLLAITLRMNSTGAS